MIDFSIKAENRGLVVTEASRVAKLTNGTTETSRTASIGQVLGQNRSQYLVSRAGAYRFALDTTVALARVDSQVRLLNSLPSSRSGNAPDRLLDAIARPTASALDEGYRRRWDFLVGWILRRKWAQGDSMVDLIPVEVPNDSGRLLQVPRTLRYDGVVSCPATNSAHGARRTLCWQFSSTMSFPKEFMRASMERAKARATANLPPEMVAELEARMPVPEQSIETVGVYDATTMVPLRITNTTRVTSKSATINSRIETVSTSIYAWH
ncbi:MAG: hypothetical protein IBJ03_15065 [Gemmatimonadaceae bacterium]|nr:hypothetical protein [Gemmatimonadaceae bacterium]